MKTALGLLKKSILRGKSKQDKLEKYSKKRQKWESLKKSMLTLVWIILLMEEEG